MRTIFQQSVRTSLALSALVLAIGNAMAAPIEVITSVDASGATSSAAPAISADALARAQTKFAHAMTIVDQFKAQAQAEGIPGDAWRFEMAGNMMKGTEENFASVSLARSYHDAMRAAFQVGKASASANVKSAGDSSAQTENAQSVSPKSLGLATTDLVYVPITPCRVLDTRAAGAAVPTGTAKNYVFYASNVGSSSCTVTGQIPGNYTAAAFAANVTVDETGLTGFAAGAYLQIYPQGGSTATSFMNFGPNQILANAGIISLNQANSEFTIVASAPSQVIVDTYGVFIAPQPTALECSTVKTSQSLPISFNGYYYTTLSCPANTTTTAPYCYNPSVSGVYASGSGINPTAFCSWINLSGAVATVYQGQTCCQIPGR
jgi:hypothetical protein